MIVVDDVVSLLRSAHFENVRPNRLSAEEKEGIAVRFVTSVITAVYYDGTKAEEVSYQAIVRKRSEAEAFAVAEQLMDFLDKNLPNCRGCRMVSNDRQLLPQELQLDESGYYETMVQFTAGIITR